MARTKNTLEQERLNKAYPNPIEREKHLAREAKAKQARNERLARLALAPPTDRPLWQLMQIDEDYTPNLLLFDPASVPDKKDCEQMVKDMYEDCDVFQGICCGEKDVEEIPEGARFYYFPGLYVPADQKDVPKDTPVIQVARVIVFYPSMY